MVRRRALQLTVIAAGVVCVAAGAVLVLGGSRDRTIIPAPLITSTPVAIVEKLPAPTAAATPANVTGTAATHIRVPDLGIDLDVVPGDGVNAPLYKAVEYPSPMKLPGQGGRSMIYAHARAGMFGPLFNAKPGQRIDVTLADGRRLHYTIREYYAHWPVNDLRWFDQVSQEQLILVTCTTYDPNDPRIVVVAEPA